jgi:hypothetical protein
VCRRPQANRNSANQQREEKRMAMKNKNLGKNLQKFYSVDFGQSTDVFWFCRFENPKYFYWEYKKQVIEFASVKRKNYRFSVNLQILTIFSIFRNFHPTNIEKLGKRTFKLQKRRN